jgi:hypothetical protein
LFIIPRIAGAEPGDNHFGSLRGPHPITSSGMRRQIFLDDDLRCFKGRQSKLRKTQLVTDVLLSGQNILA